MPLRWRNIREERLTNQRVRDRARHTDQMAAETAEERGRLQAAGCGFNSNVYSKRKPIAPDHFSVRVIITENFPPTS